MDIGRVTAIRTLENSTPITSAGHESTVIIKIEQEYTRGDRLIMYNREFDFSHKLYLKISKETQIPHHWRTTEDPWLKSFLKVFGFKFHS